MKKDKFAGIESIVKEANHNTNEKKEPINKEKRVTRTVYNISQEMFDIINRQEGSLSAFFKIAAAEKIKRDDLS